MTNLGLIEIILIFILFGIAIWLLIRKRLKRSGDKKRSSSNYEVEDKVLTKPIFKTSQPEDKKIKPFSPKFETKAENKASSQIFISYRRNDSGDITGRIYDRLVPHFGRDRIFKDVDSIPLGMDFKKHLDLAVAQCSIFLIVIGPNWLYSNNKNVKKSLIHDPADFVRIELESALTREIPVIPLFVRGATMPSKEDLPDNFQQLIYRNGIAIRPDPDFHIDMDRLIRAIEGHFKTK